MNYPIVQVKTKDDLTLSGLLLEPYDSTSTIKIHIHGTAGSFFWNSFYEKIAQSALELNISQLNTNNRGAGVYEVEAGSKSLGASLELFNECLLDIDAWIEFAQAKGYSKIILEGHSFGCDKIIYYMNNGMYRDKVIAVILLGFGDNIGSQIKHESKIGKSYFEEATKLVNSEKSEYLLSDLDAFVGELPISAQTYLDFFSKESEDAKTLPLRLGKDLPMYQSIRVPILGIIGDREDSEYTIIPISEAIELLKSENKLAEIHQIENSNHGFEGKEQELVKIITQFIKMRIVT